MERSIREMQSADCSAALVHARLAGQEAARDPDARPRIPAGSKTLTHAMVTAHGSPGFFPQRSRIATRVGKFSLVDLVGGTGIEPVTSSVSGKPTEKREAARDRRAWPLAARLVAGRGCTSRST